MGCSSSVAFLPSSSSEEGGAFQVKEKRGTFTSVSSLDEVDQLTKQGGFGGPLKKRYGHPTYFRGDGYDLGLRVRVKGLYHSTFVGCARSSGEKVSIKEHHLAAYSTSKDAHVVGHDAESLVALEVLLLARLSHGSVPRLREVFLTDSAIFLVTNYLDPMRLSNFVDLKQNTCALSAADVRSVMRSVCSAVAHCHEHGVLVRDLSPNNIMVRKQQQQQQQSKENNKDKDGSSAWEVVIADFSLAVSAGSLQVLSDHPLFDWSLVPYTAPEALLGHPYSYPMDCWALGALMYTLLSGHEAFHHDDDHVLVQNIRTASFDFEEDAFDSVDESAKTAISHVLKVTPTKRWTAQQFLKCPWFVSA